MLKRMFLFVLAACCMSAGAVEPVHPKNTPANQEAHEKGKKSGGGFMEDLMKAMGASPSVPGWNPQGSLTREAGKEQGQAELFISACYQQVQLRQIRREISPECQTVLNPSFAASGLGVSPGATNETSRYVYYLCVELIDSNQGIGNPLRPHCENLVAAYNKLVENMNKRDGVTNGANLGRTPTAQDKQEAKANKKALEDAYSECKPSDRLVSPAQIITETCEVEQAITKDNICSKTLATRVDWQCPTGAVSGPTRVRAATATVAGQYTCQVPEPRNVYTCPAGWTGPSELPIPPSNQRGQACTNPANAQVQAATMTVQQVLVDRDARAVETDSWSSNCNALEASAPLNWRTTERGVSPPMAAFSPAGIERCRLFEASCTSSANATLMINDWPVTRACRSYSENFACMTGKTVNTCANDARCVDKSSSCQPEDMDGDVCMTQTVTRECTVKEAVYTAETSCANQKFCPNGFCYDTGSKPNEDFGKVTALMAASNNAGRYLSASDMQIFKGFGGRCRSLVMGGIFNCCDKNKIGKMFYNALHLGPKLMKPWEEKATDDTATLDENGKPMLSKKTLDFLNTADNTGMLAASVRAVASMQGTASKAFEDLKDKDYKGAAKTVFWTGPRDLAHSIGNGLAQALEEAITLFGILDGCDEQDWAVTAKLKDNLCFSVGSKVTEKVFRWAWERERRYCCFNSMLAMLINSQGREQFMEPQYQPVKPSKPTNPPNYRSMADSLFGTGPGPTKVEEMYGGVNNRNCNGFSMDQLKVLDFSRIDLTPFIASLETKEAELAENYQGKDGKTNKQRIQEAATRMYLNKCGGSGQCDGPNPFASADSQPPVDANGNFILGPDGKPLPPKGTANGASGIQEYVKLRPLMFKAFNEGWAAGTINNEDIRLFSKFRFRSENVPLTAQVAVITELKGSGSAKVTTGPIKSDLAGCKLMKITLTRPETINTWTDANIQDPKTGEWRPPNMTKSKKCIVQPPYVDPATGRTVQHESCEWTYDTPNPNGNDPAPASYTETYPGYSADSMVTFCGDGTVPGSGL